MYYYELNFQLLTNIVCLACLLTKIVGGVSMHFPHCFQCAALFVGDLLVILVIYYCHFIRLCANW